MDKSIKNPEEETTLKSNTPILVCKHETHKRKTAKFCQYGPEEVVNLEQY